MVFIPSFCNCQFLCLPTFSICSFLDPFLILVPSMSWSRSPHPLLLWPRPSFPPCIFPNPLTQLSILLAPASLSLLCLFPHRMCFSSPPPSFPTLPGPIHTLEPTNFQPDQELCPFSAQEPVGALGNRICTETTECLDNLSLKNRKGKSGCLGEGHRACIFVHC